MFKFNRLPSSWAKGTEKSNLIKLIQKENIQKIGLNGFMRCCKLFSLGWSWIKESCTEICSGLDSHHKNYMLNPLYTLSEVLFTQSVRNKVKGSFQTAGQRGSTPPRFCNFPKPTNRQTNSHVRCSVTGQVCIGEKWAEL